MSLAATYADIRQHDKAVEHYRQELALRQGNPKEVRPAWDSGLGLDFLVWACHMEEFPLVHTILSALAVFLLIYAHVIFVCVRSVTRG